MFQANSNQFNNDDESDEEETIICTKLKDYSNDDTQIDENGKFVQVVDDDGSKKTVLKSSILWMLTESQEKLSKDRLQRVQGSNVDFATKKRKGTSRSSLFEKKKKMHDLYVSEDILISDWCFFRNQQSKTKCEEFPIENTYDFWFRTCSHMYKR